jgi:hypothetical protein
VVTFDFLDRRSAERFAELLDETTGGRRHHVRGQADEQLAELVAIGHSLSGARCGVQVEAEFRTGLRAMLVATAERDGIGRTAQPHTEPVENIAARTTGRRLFGKGSGRRIRARGAIVIGVAAGAMAVSGISAASENAAPGDALYGVKRSTERAQLAMAGSDLTRGQLSLDFARHRLAEAAALPGDNTRFADVLDDMDNDTRQGVRLLTGSAVARTETSPLGTVDAFVTAQRQRMTPVLDGLSPANRERAAASMNLLDDVHERAVALRAGLACEPVVPDGSDLLGPKLNDCATDSSAPQHQQVTGERPGKPGDSSKTSKANPAKTGAVVDPTSTGEAQTPTGNADPGVVDGTPTTTATTSQLDEPAEQDDSGDDGPLGGLLSNIFGGG